MPSRNRKTKRYGFSFRWSPKGEWWLKGDFPPPNRRVRAVAWALLVVLLLVLAKITGLELSAVLALLKPVIAPLL